MMPFGHILGKKNGREEIRFTMEGDCLIINCKGCKFTPEPSSTECIRCMVLKCSDAGSCDRIVLRTSRDVEISGACHKALNRIAALKRWSLSSAPKERKCRRCCMSRQFVMRRLWDDYPLMNYALSRSSVDVDVIDERCTRCIMSTTRAIDRVESDMERIRLDLLR